MKIQLEVEVEPFAVPDEVSRVLGGQPMPLAELPVAALGQLCAVFRDGVFKKAGKPDPLGTHPRVHSVFNARDLEKRLP